MYFEIYDGVNQITNIYIPLGTFGRVHSQFKSLLFTINKICICLENV